MFEKYVMRDVHELLWTYILWRISQTALGVSWTCIISCQVLSLRDIIISFPLGVQSAYLWASGAPPLHQYGLFFCRDKWYGDIHAIGALHFHLSGDVCVFAKDQSISAEGGGESGTSRQQVARKCG